MVLLFVYLFLNQSCETFRRASWQPIIGFLRHDFFVTVDITDCDEGTRKRGTTESEARRKRQRRGRTKGKTTTTRERAGNSA